MRLALKTAARPTLLGPVSHAIGKRLDHAAHSHGEIVFANGISASAVMGEGVRFKPIRYTSGAWDFWTLPDELEERARRWFHNHAGEDYDYRYMLRFMGLTALRDQQNRWGCFEAIAAALGWRGPFRYGPGGVLDRCIDVYGSFKVDSPFASPMEVHPVVAAAALGKMLHV